MNIWKYLLILCLLCTPSGSTKAQNFDGSFLKDHLSRKYYSLDSEANAIVLYEKRRIKLDHQIALSRTEGQFIHIYRLIKILKSSALELADVSTGYIVSGSSFIKNEEGATYNIENGELKKTVMSKSAIHEKKDNRYYETLFTLPNVKVGSIIEYAYDIYLPFETINSPWYIEGGIPKLLSEYEIDVPAANNYYETLQGDIHFKECTTPDEIKPDSVQAYRLYTKQDRFHYTILWGKRNIASVNAEPFISDLANHMQRLDLQLSAQNKGFLSKDRTLAKWEQIDHVLMEHMFFGKQIETHNKFFRKVLDTLPIENANPVAKARFIYKYVCNNIDCRSVGGIYCSNFLKKIFENRKGSAADVNLLLVAMLRAADLEAYPVILSTVGNLQLREDYPLLDRINYVVCMVEIDNVKYYLDASSKYMPFGYLPLYCYNGYARIISGTGYAVSLTNNSLNEKSVYIANVSGLCDTSYDVNISERLGVYSSMSLRKQYKRDTSAFRQYANKKAQLLPGTITISDITLPGLNEPDSSLVMKYKFHVSNKQKSIFYINADIDNFFSENPFRSQHRKLPIEFPYKMEYQYTLNVALPKNISIDEIPKSALEKYDNTMLLENKVNYDQGSGMLTVKTNLTISKTDFTAKEYDSIKIFFGKVLESESNMLVLKKRN